MFHKRSDEKGGHYRLPLTTVLTRKNLLADGLPPAAQENVPKDERLPAVGPCTVLARMVHDEAVIVSDTEVRVDPN